jgi:RND family efflux transporter MFP subunit
MESDDRNTLDTKAKHENGSPGARQIGVDDSSSTAPKRRRKIERPASVGGNQGNAETDDRKRLESQSQPSAGEGQEQTQPPVSRRKLRRVGLVALVLAVSAAGIGIFLRHRHEQQVREWTHQATIPTVSVVTPTGGSSTFELVLPGDVKAWYEAPIYARVSGYLKNWYYDYGAEVKKGDLLAEIDAPDLDAEFAAALSRYNVAQEDVQAKQAQKEFAETTYARWKNSPTGVVSEQEREAKRGEYGSAVAALNSAKASAEAAEREVNRLSAMESFKHIIAPFDGVLTARETDIGALINAGSGTGPELFRVADVHEMRIYVAVPQQMTGGLHNGLTAELHLPEFAKKTFQATVATTSRSIALNSRTLLVELHAENADGLLQPGAYAEIDFKLPNSSGVMQVPTGALLFREHGLEVATVDANDKIKLKKVTLGRNLGTEVEVEQGLTQADRVIDSPPDSVQNGDQVQVKAGQTADSSKK